jgi:hypothetical protein
LQTIKKGRVFKVLRKVKEEGREIKNKKIKLG